MQRKREPCEISEFVSRADEEMLTGLVEVVRETLAEEWKKTDPWLTLSIEKINHTENKKVSEGKLVELKGLDGNDFFDLLKFFIFKTHLYNLSKILHHL